VQHAQVPGIRPISPHARRLRRDATDAEQKFWLEVRDRRLGGFKFRRQATIGPFVVDFLCAAALLIVEIDGGQHDAASDAARTAYLESRGYRVLRFWNIDVLTNMDGVLQTALTELGALPVANAEPSPNPLPQAGEGL
jgi:adenine-specific DNA-methyltransferase